MPPVRDLGMSSLFGSTAVSQSLGLTGLSHALSLDSTGTRSMSQPLAVDNSTASSASLETPRAKKSIEDRLFDAKANAKIFTSQVAMRIQDNWRKQLYRQLDSLLDADEWMEGDEPLAIGSYQTFLRLMFVIRPKIRPGLGLTTDGHLMATWHAGEARLTIYCFANDTLRYVLSHVVDGKRQAHAGDASIERLTEWIAPFQPEQWFGREPE